MPDLDDEKLRATRKLNGADAVTGKNVGDIKIGVYVRNEDGYIEKIESLDKATNIYEDEEGKLRKWEGEDIYGNEYTTLITKHSKNIIDLLENGDFTAIEFYSPRYEERVTRIFEVVKIDNYITFENMHCDLFIKDGKWSIKDGRLKPIIKTIVTHEQFNSVMYKVKE